MTKRVFIHAYAAGNLGDDLLIKILCERYPKVRFRMVVDAEYRQYYSKIKNLKVYSPTDRIAVMIDKMLKKIKNIERGFWKILVKSSDVTVHIGGSVFVQHLEDYSAAFRLDETLRRLSKKIVVMGANFGPYTNETYYQQYHDLFKGYESVSFRDTYSAGLFHDLSNVIYAPDIAFNLKVKEDSIAKKKVLFSVIDLKSRGGKFPINQYTCEYENFLIKMIKMYIQDGYEIELLSFCCMEGDEEAIKELIEKLDPEEKKKVGASGYKGNLDECIQKIAESEIVIATRFHAVILGWLFGKKVFPIIYNQKTKKVLNDMKVSFCMTMEEIGHMDINKVIQQIKESKEISLDKTVKMAEKHFVVLDKILQ
ncbi:MAG: polysaccharide pyruvyl transferase family protein [Lachnospiraceae bacterium]|nr:polysaccharide pyruvyl transferase family protein [Lachnospiraceae bacterium]